MSEITTKEKSRQKITSRQKQELLELMSSKPLLRAGKFTTNFTHKDAQSQWEIIAEVINAIPGARKTWKAWRKVNHN